MTDNVDDVLSRFTYDREAFYNVIVQHFFGYGEDSRDHIEDIIAKMHPSDLKHMWTCLVRVCEILQDKEASYAGDWQRQPWHLRFSEGPRELQLVYETGYYGTPEEFFEEQTEKHMDRVEKLKEED